jgi:hypothetical protein
MSCRLEDTRGMTSEGQLAFVSCCADACASSLGVARRVSVSGIAINSAYHVVLNACVASTRGAPVDAFDSRAGSLRVSLEAPRHLCRVTAHKGGREVVNL